MKRVLNIRKSTVLKLLGCGMLVFLTADLQAQLIYKTKFSAVEGYTNGWVIGQPSVGNKWSNANNDWDWVNANNPAYNNMNDGKSWWPEGATEPWYIATATNCSAPGGGAMKIASDNNWGTNTGTYFFKMDFPTQLKGPITVTWDWQFFSTNEIPADYNVYTNNYSSTLPGYDHGFTFSDWENRWTGDGNPNWVYNELCTPFRLGGVQDARHNFIGACGGFGDWNNYGPEFKDHKVLHMKLTAFVTNAPPEYVDSYEAFCQRDGETNWQTAFREDTVVPKIDYVNDYTNEITIAASGMRRCPGEYDPTSGVNCLMLWMNSTQYPRYVTVSNIRVVGPNPVAKPALKVEKIGTNVKLTFDGWLEAAASPQGPYTTVAVTSPILGPAATAAKQFSRASN